VSHQSQPHLAVCGLLQFRQRFLKLSNNFYKLMLGHGGGSVSSMRPGAGEYFTNQAKRKQDAVFKIEQIFCHNQFRVSVGAAGGAQ
jgi:hypothetical protein